ncbi:MAG: glycosyltransferase [Bacteroidales bacterium]|nr:glycosyltransferase [Bacteroidales bacterium]
MKNSPGISIIVCCHNSSSLLSDTLHHLAQLRLPDRLPVEIVLVDNASTDNTDEVARGLWVKNGNPFPLTIIQETKPGLIYARKKGLAISLFEYLVFVDDDNWLDPDYLLHVKKTFDQNEFLGAVGGINAPVFETEKPFWFDDFQHSYAVGNLAKKYSDSKEVALFGAGLCIRRTAYNSLLAAGFSSRLTGRSGESLSSGEDYELVKALKIAGWKILFNPQLKLRHFITAHRLNWPYFIKLNRGISHSIYIFLAYDYWIEKIYNSSGLIAKLRFSWFWLTFKKIVKQITLKILLMIFPANRKEGSNMLIEFERTKIVTRDLLKNRKQFVALKKSIGKIALKQSKSPR